MYFFLLTIIGFFFFMFGNQKPAREDSRCDPWTSLARHKLDVERALENFVDLDYVIVRPAIVYGLGDRNGLSKFAENTLCLCVDRIGACHYQKWECMEGWCIIFF